MHNSECTDLSAIIFVIKEDEIHLFNENDKILCYANIKQLQKLSARESQPLMFKYSSTLQSGTKYYSVTLILSDFIKIYQIRQNIFLKCQEPYNENLPSSVF